MYLIAIPAFTDNYIWLLHDDEHAVVVDPGDAQPVLAELARWSLKLTAILVTHHHNDHTGGLASLHQITNVPVYGPANECIPQPYVPLQQHDQVQVLGLNFKVLDVPGHTVGHIAFYCAACPLDQTTKPLLFCGDTLFSAGCGRLFEGTPAQMLASLNRIARLPEETQICCEHEYTLSNLRFALTVEPNTPELIAYHARCLRTQHSRLPTLPSSVCQKQKTTRFCAAARQMSLPQYAQKIHRWAMMMCPYLQPSDSGRMALKHEHKLANSFDLCAASRLRWYGTCCAPSYSRTHLTPSNHSQCNPYNRLHTRRRRYCNYCYATSATHH